MSNLAHDLRAARPAPATGPRQQPRHIEIVSTRAQRRARPKLAYAIITIASLFAIFTAQLLLSIVVSEGAYQVSALQDQQRDLLRTQDALTEQLNVLDSTQNLSLQAASLGMVPNGTPLALNLATGSVYGLPGSADPAGCGGACNLITNARTSGIPLAKDVAALAAATAATGAAGHADTPASTTAPATQTEQAPADTIPAPVTH
jgi:hypothetical protein